MDRCASRKDTDDTCARELSSAITKGELVALHLPTRAGVHRKGLFIGCRLPPVGRRKRDPNIACWPFGSDIIDEQWPSAESHTSSYARRLCLYFAL
jgi:hypothetical protein